MMLTSACHGMLNNLYIAAFPGRPLCVSDARVLGHRHCGTGRAIGMIGTAEKAAAKESSGPFHARSFISFAKDK